jgi:hypothetical protein
MSTLKSSSTDLTLNADGVGNDIIFQSNAGQVGKLTAEGVLTATSFVGSAATLTAIPAANITGTLPAISGANLTNLPADATKLPLAGGTLTGTLAAKVATTATNTDTSNTGSVTLDFSTHQNFVLTLTGNVTLANPSTEAIGQSGFIAFIQDSTGSRTVALGTDYETPAAAGLTLTSTASATDLVPYLVVAANRILLGAPQLAFA